MPRVRKKTRKQRADIDPVVTKRTGSPIFALAGEETPCPDVVMDDEHIEAEVQTDLLDMEDIDEDAYQPETLNLKETEPAVEVRTETAEQAVRTDAVLGDDARLFRIISGAHPGDPLVARAELVQRHQRLAYGFAHRFPWKDLVEDAQVDAALELKDLFQVCFLALLRAIRKFDYTRGLRFSTYAYTWFRGFVQRFFHNSGTIHIPVYLWGHFPKYLEVEKRLRAALGAYPSPREIQAAMGLPEDTFQLVVGAVELFRARIVRLSAIMGDEENGRQFVETLDLEASADADLSSVADAWSADPSAHELYEQFERARAVRRVLNSGVLMESERDVLIQRFGLDGEAPRTMEQVGEQRGVTRQRIEQLEKAALKKLRRLDLWEDAADYLPHRPEDEGGEEESRTANSSTGRIQTRQREQAQVALAGVILLIVCRYYGITEAEVTGKEQSKTLDLRRQVLMYLLYEHTSMSYPRIGMLLGGMDNTTVVQGHRQVRDRLGQDPALNRDVYRIERQIDHHLLSSPGKEEQS